MVCVELYYSSVFSHAMVSFYSWYDAIFSHFNQIGNPSMQLVHFLEYGVTNYLAAAYLLLRSLSVKVAELDLCKHNACKIVLHLLHVGHIWYLIADHHN